MFPRRTLKTKTGNDGKRWVAKRVLSINVVFLETDQTLTVQATSEQWEHRREDQQALRKLEVRTNGKPFMIGSYGFQTFRRCRRRTA